MAALRLPVRRNLFASGATTSFGASRAFSTSLRALASKEDKLHSEGRAEEIETHKQDALKKSKEGKGHWKDELASSSESVIKAERGEIDASEETIKKLQEEAKKVGQK